MEKLRYYQYIIATNYGVTFLKAFKPTPSMEQAFLIFIVFAWIVNIYSLFKLKLSYKGLLKVVLFSLCYQIPMYFINYYLKGVVSLVVSTIILCKVLKYVENKKTI